MIGNNIWMLIFATCIVAIDFLDAYVWFHKTQSNKIPEWCEPAGYQYHKEYSGKLYVATTTIGTEKIIGKADERGRGFFPKDGIDYHLDSYELLCAIKPDDWVDKTGNSTKNAVPSGISADGIINYICIGKHKTSLLPGKFRKSYDCCYVRYVRQEYCAKEYSILIYTP